MATNSRNTNTFAGLLSWLCLLVVLCGACCAVVFFTLVLANPHTLRFAAGHLQEITGSAEGYFHPGPVVEEAPRQDLVYNYTVQIISALAILGTALVLIFLFRQDRHAFENLVAKGLGKIWVELKLGALGLLFLLSLLIVLEGYGMKKAFALTVLCVLTVYLLCLDISRNRRFFSHNILHSFLVRVNRYETMSTFEQRALRRVYSVVGIIGGLVVLYVVSLFVFQHFIFYVQILLAATSIVSVGVVGTVWWYILALKRDLRDWNLLMDQITEMYGGDLNAVNHVSPTSNLYDCAMQLNMIRTGVQKAVEEGTKADRTKIELITNVSHDIKTPLTSIISYVELLKKEPDLPPTAADYVNTIAQKAQRLSGIVQDVFEVSKAATGNISLNLEDLDLGRLMRQTLVEMEQTIQRSQLVWRVDIPEVPMVIHADGQRLYRVLQNLIRNCTQYSLEGSRVYVTLSAQSGQALVNIRNISKNEITMNGEDLTARFVRGDQNRTTEGSGLGLSIAKSFTEACGGTFFVRTDGDMFTVTVQFPLVALRPERVPILQVESPPAAPEPINLDDGTKEGGLS